MKNSNGLSFFVATKISLRRNWVSRFFTIVILSICFTACGLISIFYTGNYTDTYVNAVLNSAVEYTGFCFRGSYELYDQSEYSVLGQELIDYIKNKTKREYVYSFAYFVDAIETGKYMGYTPENVDLVYGDFGEGVYADSETAYESLGFKVLAGRYPESVYEIAVNEKCFESFKANGGYCDRSVGFYYYEKGGYVDLDQSKVIEQKVEPINNYEDLIGKTVMCYGDVENGIIEGSSEFYFVKIVGVIDSHYDKSLATTALRGYYPTLAPSIFYSKEWVNLFSSGEGGDYLSVDMYTQKVTTYAEASKFISVANSAREFVDTLIAEKQAEGKALNATSEGVGLIETNRVNNCWQEDGNAFLIFVPVGIVFGIFSIVLVIFLTSATLNNQKRQIGVLRALGLNKSGIIKVAWSGILPVSVISFALSTLATFLLYRFLMFPTFYLEYVGVSFIFFNIWNVLLLAALAFIVPLLASIPSIVRFSKRSVAEILTDRSTSKKQKKAKYY